jgi:hypothetical protein
MAFWSLNKTIVLVLAGDLPSFLSRSVNDHRLLVGKNAIGGPSDRVVLNPTAM